MVLLNLLVEASTIKVTLGQKRVSYITQNCLVHITLSMAKVKSVDIAEVNSNWMAKFTEPLH